MVTENGMCDDGKLKDIGRINFLKAYIDEVLKGEQSMKLNNIVIVSLLFKLHINVLMNQQH